MSLRLVTILTCALLSRAAVAEPQAGFSHLVTPSGVEVNVWYPASGTPGRQRSGLGAQLVVLDGTPLPGRHPLVVISHGTGGDYAGHADTAVALARAGFVAAALTHPGDNWRDAGRATRIEQRPAALGRLVTYLLADWPGRAGIDHTPIGAFGFSAGGFTVLATAGGRPDLTRLGRHCADLPAFFDCTLLRGQPRPEAEAPTWQVARDPRLRALVVAAPALGFTFERAGLADVRVRVQLWRADDDQVLPAPFYADAVRTALPLRPEFHHVARAGHFDFLQPCAHPAAMALPCRSAPGFDRVTFHARFNAIVVRFVRRTLRR